MPYVRRIEHVGQIQPEHLGLVSTQAMDLFPCQAWFLDDDDPQTPTRHASRLFRQRRGQRYVDEVLGQSMRVFMLDYHVPPDDWSEEEEDDDDPVSLVNVMGCERTYRNGIRTILDALGLNWADVPCLAVFLDPATAEAGPKILLDLKCSTEDEVRNRLNQFAGYLDGAGTDAFGADLWQTVRAGELQGALSIEQRIDFHRALRAKFPQPGQSPWLRVIDTVTSLTKIAALVGPVLTPT